MRYHPLTVFFHIYQLVKNSIVIAILLFVLRKDSEFWLIEYGRYAFVIFIVLRLCYIVIAWFVEKYEWQDRTFYIHKGIFMKHTSTIPFSKIQNVTRKTTIFHKIFGLTSVTFETAMDGEDDAIHFEVLSRQHANFLIGLVQTDKQNALQNEQVNSDATQTESQENKDPKQDAVQKTNRTVHFTPQRQDLWKASFTSLSFLAFIPIAFGVLDYINPLLPETDQVEGIFQLLLDSKWIFIVIIILAVTIAVAFGALRTFIRYGRYEISSDAAHIYIDRGVLNESHFAIEKRKVQGLEIQQTMLKRLFGLAEVKLISSANPNKEERSVNVNSLYPFLPIKEAYQLIEELLPIYQLNGQLERLPRRSLWVKLLKPSWLWIMATISLIYFKPDFFGINQAWWILILVLLCLILLQRILDYIHTRYAVTQDQVQWWHGGLTSRLFVTKRKNVIEIAYSQTKLQKYFQVASVTTMNRSIPAHKETIHDIPLPYALAIEKWYLKRQKEVL